MQAPVIDSCGSAGGRKPGQGNGGFGASFVNTTHAKVGDLGSQTLPVRDTGVVWKSGAEYEVAWTLQAVGAGLLQSELETVRYPAAMMRHILTHVHGRTESWRRILLPPVSTRV